MKLIDVLSFLFDSFSFRIEDLMGVGRLKTNLSQAYPCGDEVDWDWDWDWGKLPYQLLNTKALEIINDPLNNPFKTSERHRFVTWYVYLVTPATYEAVQTLIPSGLIFCPRDKNLLIRSSFDLKASTPICISKTELKTLRQEVRSSSEGTDMVSCSVDSGSQGSCNYLELNLGL